MIAKFNHFDLILVEPTFDSNLTDLIIDLDYLRKKQLNGTTHPRVFFQLKHIFHLLESLGSARIEGNNTTLAEYIETKLEKQQTIPLSIQEIQNIENAMNFIEEHINSHPINKVFISEIHKMVVNGLLPPPDGEGDNTPGIYRKGNVGIGNSAHKPPEGIQVGEYMDELFNFIKNQDSQKYDLLKVAIAHHRFVWIHPFNNGNGRTVRLFTYAMLVKLGFNVNAGRILNPTAVFCNNRNNYYDFLSLADSGTREGILNWCEYVLKGLKNEIEKIDKLLNYDYLRDEILLPTIDYAIERQYITNAEAKILKIVIEKQVIQAADLKSIFPGKVDAEVSRQIRKLIDKNMLIPEKENGRKYVIRFDNNYLLRGIIKSLDDKGFLPIKERL
jgi:Fic family protein